MERNTKQVIRRKKQLTALQALFVLCMAALLVFYGHVYSAIILAAAYYLIREAYLSDHTFYSVTQDYAHNLSPDWTLTTDDISALNGKTIFPAADTLLLAVKIHSRLTGYLWDPFVEVTVAGISCRQYFERGAHGLRYINLTQLALSTDKTVALDFHHCYPEGAGEWLGFKNVLPASKKRIMVIAPHADDAELAAFGVYSTHDAMIVTITAGEIEAEEFLATEPDPVKASQLKGQLRSEDSLAAGLLAGVAATHIVSLGYFCKQLSTMYARPTNTVVSLTAGTDDPRLFRRFNTIRLASDVDGKSSWVSLIGDLKELLALHKPEIIITPHPLLDPHPDHIFATKALVEALQDSSDSVTSFLLYANHYHNSQIAPFGPAHSAVGLPPHHSISSPKLGVYSQMLDEATQIKKVAALQLMHDLQKTPSWTKRLRPTLQKWLAGRPESTYGSDDFFRKAVRCHEVFFVADYAKLRELLSES